MWFHNNTQQFEIPENAISFIYRITNLTNDKFYIGRKMLLSNRKKKLTLKEKALEGNSRKKFKREIKPTNWENYWGSNDELLNDIKELGEDKFKREILIFTENKTDTSFWEMAIQIKEDVLFKNSYNRHIANTKFFKGKVNEISTNS